MGLVKYKAKQDRANHTAQDDSQSYPTGILLFALGKSNGHIFGIYTQNLISPPITTNCFHKGVYAFLIPESVGERPDSTRSTWRKTLPR